MSLLRRNASEDATVPRRHRGGASAFTVGLIVLVVLVVATYLGFTKHIPFTHGFRVRGGLPVGELDPAELAGADRGRERRQGHEHRADARRRHGDRDDGDRRQGPAAPQGRDGQDPAADLPRGQLLRRPPARDAVDADDRRRRHAAGQPDRRPGPARPGPHRAAAGHAHQPAAARRRAGRRPHVQAAARARHRRRSVGPRPERGGVAERLDPLRAAPRCAARPRSPPR